MRRLLVALLLLVLGLAGTVWAVLRSEAVGAWAIGRALPLVSDALPGALHVGSFSGFVGGRLDLRDVRIDDVRGTAFIEADRLLVTYDLRALLSLRVVASEVRLERPRFRLEEVDGQLNVVGAFVKPGPPKPPSGKPPPDLAIEAPNVVIVDGTFSMALPTGELRLDGIGLDAGYTLGLRAMDHGFAVRLVEAALRAPLDLPKVALSADAGLLGTDLTIRSAHVDWQQTALDVTGGIALSPLSFDLSLASPQGVHLPDIDAVAKVGLTSTVHPTLTAQGPLSGMTLSGSITTAGGATIEIPSGFFGLGDPLLHRAEIGLTAVHVEEIVPVPDGVVPELNGRVRWDGQGAGLDTLAGVAEVRLQGFPYQGLDLDRVAVDARLADAAVDVTALVVGVGGSEITGTAGAHLTDGTFRADLAARSLDLAAFAGISRGGVQAGLADLAVRADGGWKGQVAVTTDGHLKAAGLKVPGADLALVDATWAVDVAVGKGLPDVVGVARVQTTEVVAAGATQVIAADVSATLTGQGAGVRLAAARDARVHLEFDGAVDWSRLPDLGVAGDRLAATVQLVDRPFDITSDRPFRFDIRGKQLALEGLTLLADGARLSATATMEPGQRVEGDVGLRALDLARIDPLLAGLGLDAVTKLSGRLEDVRVHASGPLSAPAIEVAVAGRGVVLDGRPPLHVDVRLDAGEGGVTGTVGVNRSEGGERVVSLDLVALPLHLDLSGGPPAWLEPDGAWELRAEVPATAATALFDLVPGPPPPPLAASTVAASVVWKGTTRAPDLVATATVSALKFSDLDASVRVTAAVEQGRLSFRQTQVRTPRDGTVLTLDGGGVSRLGETLLAVLGPKELRGPVPPVFEGLAVAADIRSLPLPIVHSFVPALRPLTGAVRGRVSVAGSTQAPEVTAGIELLGARAGDQKLDDARVDATLLGGRLEAALTVHSGGGGLLVQAQAPLPVALPLPPVEELLGQRGLTGTIGGEGLPLAVLSSFVPGASAPQGTVILGGTVGGSLLVPEPLVTLRLADGGLCLAATSICYADLSLDAELTPDRATIRGLHLRSEPIVYNPMDRLGRPVGRGKDHTLDIAGTMALDRFRPGPMDVRVGLKQFWGLYREDLQALADGELRLSGTVERPVVRGKILLDEIRVDLGQDDVGRSVAALDLPPELRVHRVESRPGPGEQPIVAVEVQTGPGLLERLDVDVDVELGRNNRIKLAYGLTGRQSGAQKALNALANVKPDVSLTGEVAVRLQGGQLYLVGEAETIRGSGLTVLTREFSLRDGSGITFTGLAQDSQLDFHGEYSKSRYGTVVVHVTGTVSQPELTFESDTYPDQGDIMSILLTGKPLAELTSAEGKSMGSTLASLLAGVGNQALGKFNPVDSLEFEFGDDVGSGSIEAGKAIGDKLYLVTRFRWGAEADENVVEAQVEYRIDRRWSLEGWIGDKLKGAVEVVFKIPY